MIEYVCGFFAKNSRHFDPQKLGRCAVCKEAFSGIIKDTSN